MNVDLVIGCESRHLILRSCRWLPPPALLVPTLSKVVVGKQGVVGSKSTICITFFAKRFTFKKCDGCQVVKVCEIFSFICRRKCTQGIVDFFGLCSPRSCCSVGKRFNRVPVFSAECIPRFFCDLPRFLCNCWSEIFFSRTRSSPSRLISFLPLFLGPK